MLEKLWSTPVLYKELPNWQEHTLFFKSMMLAELSQSADGILDGSGHNVWDWGTESVEWLRGHMTSAVIELFASEDKKIEEPEKYWGRAWGNVLSSNGPAHQFLHAHHEADVFSVFYVDIGDTDSCDGSLHLLDPRFSQNTNALNRDYRKVIQPKNGWLLMAPGYVWHEVTPYYKQTPRMSIACNYQYSLMTIRD